MQRGAKRKLTWSEALEGPVKRARNIQEVQRVPELTEESAEAIPMIESPRMSMWETEAAFIPRPMQLSPASPLARPRPRPILTPITAASPTSAIPLPVSILMRLRKPSPTAAPLRMPMSLPSSRIPTSPPAIVPFTTVSLPETAQVPPPALVLPAREPRPLFCLDHVVDAGPLIYILRRTALLFAWWRETGQPVAIKIGSIQDEAQLHAAIWQALSNVCPNIVRFYCSVPLSEDEVMNWLNRHRAQLDRCPPPKRKTYSVDDFFRQINAASSVGNYYALITERIASPFSFSYFSRPEAHEISYETFICLVFQLLWTVHCFQSRGFAHGDLFYRNIWLQPIRREFDYVWYVDEQRLSERAAGFYVPLAPTQHFLAKVGDYGETRQNPTFEKACQDLKALTVNIEAVQRHCRDTRCLEAVRDLLECLNLCSTGCAGRVGNLLLLPVFVDTFGSEPPVSQRNHIITPDLYFDADIIDLSSLPQRPCT